MVKTIEQELTDASAKLMSVRRKVFKIKMRIASSSWGMATTMGDAQGDMEKARELICQASSILAKWAE